MGRKSLLTPECQKIIIDALDAGNYFDTSCQLAGISYQTGYNWINRGQAELERRDNPRVPEGSELWKAEQPYVDFFEAVTRVTAKAEQKAVDGLLKQAPDDWRAYAFFLEHRYPDKWGKRRFEHTGKDGDPIEHTHTVKASELSDDDLAQIIADDK